MVGGGTPPVTLCALHCMRDSLPQAILLLGKLVGLSGSSWLVVVIKPLQSSSPPHNTHPCHAHQPAEWTRWAPPPPSHP